MIPKKYAKAIVIIITILWCLGLIGVTQQEKLIDVLGSFTEKTLTGSTSIWVIQ
jgi:hypothetical protein